MLPVQRPIQVTELALTQFGLYAQDSFQLAHNVVVDYGLRWDMETVPHDKDYKTQTYDPKTGKLADPGGAYFEGNHADFAPRFGITYSPMPKMVVRSAFGMFYQAYPVGFGAYSVPMNNIAGNYNLNQLNTPGLSYPYTVDRILGSQYGLRLSNPQTGHLYRAVEPQRCHGTAA